MEGNGEARYSYEYELTLDEYVDFNQFTSAMKAHAGTMLSKRRFLYAFLLIVFVLAGVYRIYQFGSEAFFHSPKLYGYLYFIVFSTFMLFFLSDSSLRRRVRRHTLKFVEREANAYSEHEMIAFFDDRIDAKSNIQETIIEYDKIARYHIGEQAIYIYTSSVTAFILPRRVLGGDDEAFVGFLRDKLSSRTAV